MHLNSSRLESHTLFVRYGVLMAVGTWLWRGKCMFFFCNVDYLSSENKQQIAKAYNWLYEVESGLRSPMRKTDVQVFEDLIACLLEAIISICLPYSKSNCNSIKYHSAYHWGDTRVQLGCSANERSLEKKLAETQKRNYRFTNKKDDVEVINVMQCDLM